VAETVVRWLAFFLVSADVTTSIHLGHRAYCQYSSQSVQSRSVSLYLEYFAMFLSFTLPLFISSRSSPRFPVYQSANSGY